jgi:hypothetical protein
VGKYCNNPQCFKEKTTKQNSQPAQYEKNKINKDHFEKKKEKQFIKKRKKIMQGNIVIIHNVLKKKNTELNSQLVQY